MPNPFRWMRQALEKIIFAGLKPDAPPPVSSKSKLDSLLESAEDLAALGLRPTDKSLPGPTTWRKKVGVVLALLLLGAAIFFLVKVLIRPAEQSESKAPLPPPLQIVSPEVKIDKNKNLEVVEIEFDRTKEPKEIKGTLRNRTGKTFPQCEISFDVNSFEGVQLGGAATTLHNIGPHAVLHFRIPVPQRTAGFVMVRELRTE